MGNLQSKKINQTYQRSSLSTRDHLLFVFNTFRGPSSRLPLPLPLLRAQSARNEPSDAHRHVNAHHQRDEQERDVAREEHHLLGGCDRQRRCAQRDTRVGRAELEVKGEGVEEGGGDWEGGELCAEDRDEAGDCRC